MKRMLKIFMVMIILMPTYSQAGAKLSNDEAIEIINKELKYPKGYIGRFRYEKRNNDKIDDLLNKLISNGLIIKNTDKDANLPYGSPYIATEKYKNRISIFYNIPLNLWDINIIFGAEKIKEIKEILIDEQSNTAHVEFIVVKEPFEDVYAWFKDTYHEDPQKNFDREGFKKEVIEKTKLKKSDKGWRVMK